MKHGKDRSTGEPCTPTNVKVTYATRSEWAVDGCTCGLASFDGNSLSIVLKDMADEVRMLELDGMPAVAETAWEPF